MAITLSAETQRRVEEAMKRWGFTSFEAFVSFALDAVESAGVAGMSADEMEAAYPGFREKIAEGLADLDAGRWCDGEEFFEQLEREERAADDRKTA